MRRITDLASGGIRPLFSKWSEVREERLPENYDIRKIKKFLITIGLSNMPITVFDSVSWLVWQNLRGNGILMREAYAELAEKGRQSVDAARTQITYHIKKVYKDVREAVVSQYDYDMGESFDGNKNFIHRISIVFSVFEI